MNFNNFCLNIIYIENRNKITESYYEEISLIYEYDENFITTFQNGEYSNESR